MANADPAFPDPLNDMEKHLGEKGVSSLLWPVRSRGFRGVHAPETSRVLGSDRARVDPAPAEEIGADRLAPAMIELPGSNQLASTPSPSQTSQSCGESLTRQFSAVSSEPAAPEAAAGQSDLRTLPEPKNEARRPEAWSSESWSWGSRLSGSDGQVGSMAEEEEKTKPAEDAPQSPSRLSALRGAVFSQGLKILSQRKARRKVELDTTGKDATGSKSSHTRQPTDKPVPARPAFSSVEGAVVAEGQVSPKSEIAAPREFIPLPDAGSDKGGQNDAWSDGDEVRILPAKRGQYSSR